MLYNPAKRAMGHGINLWCIDLINSSLQKITYIVTNFTVSNWQANYLRDLFHKIIMYLKSYGTFSHQRENTWKMFSNTVVMRQEPRF